jgi:hypothetical protein
MRFPEPQESQMYGNPEAIMEARQQRELRKAAAQQPVKRPVLAVRSGWSEARKRAEQLFDFPAAARSEP